MLSDRSTIFFILFFIFLFIKIFYVHDQLANAI